MGYLAWGAVGIGATLVVGWLLRPSKPVRNALTDDGAVRRMLSLLRDRGTEGATVRFQVDHDPEKCVSFSKHIRARNDIELVGSLSEARVASDRWKLVREDLERRGVNFHVTEAAGQAALQVNVTTDLLAGELFVRAALEIGFGSDPSRDCGAYFTDVLSWNVPDVTGVS